MDYRTVKFIGKEYSIPEDVLTYIDLLSFTDAVQERLKNTFVHKLRRETQKGGIGLLGDDALSDEIEQQVRQIITMLCDNGVYTRTVRDYLNNNKGYQYISDVNKAALEKIKTLMLQRLDSLQEGYEDAMQRAESHVTGMGFSVFSGSFVNHAIYAAMEASELHKQEKEASVMYKKEINELCSKLETNFDRETSWYINTEYIPNMEAAITAFAYELLDQYVSDLIEYNKFGREALGFVNISRSNDLLENLALSNNKKAILENAFIACPFNIAVYMQAIKLELLDYDSFQTAKTFKQHNHILSFLRENWGVVAFPAKFNINYYCIDIWASFTDKSPYSLLHGLTEQYATSVVRAYSRVANILYDDAACRRIMEELQEDVVLSGDSICIEKAREYVETIINLAVWEQLTSNCKHDDLLLRIKKHFPSAEAIETKESLDEHIVGQLAAKLEDARRELTAQIETRHAEEEGRRAEQETRRAEAARIQAEKKAEKADAIKESIKFAITVACGMVAIFAVVIIIGVVFRFVTNKPIDDDFAKKYADSLQGLVYAVPQKWECYEKDDNHASYRRCDSWGKLVGVMIVAYAGESPNVTVSDVVEEFKNEFVDVKSKTEKISGQTFSVVAFVEEGDEGVPLFYNVYVTEEDASVFAVGFAFVEKSNKKDVFNEIVADVEFDEYVSPTESNYTDCLSLLENTQYSKAIDLLTKLGNYKDSAELLVSAKYSYACVLIEECSYGEAIRLLIELQSYKDSEEKLVQAQYEYANILMTNKEYKEALDIFLKIPQYKDSSNKIEELNTIIYKQEQLDIYNSAVELAKISDFQAALDKLNSLQEPVQNSEELKIQYKAILSFTGVWISIEMKETNGYTSDGRMFHHAVIAKNKGDKVYFYFGLVAEYLADGTVKANIRDNMAYELRGNKLVYVGELNIAQKPQLWLEKDVLVQYHPEETLSNGTYLKAETDRYVRVNP